MFSFLEIMALVLAKKEWIQIDVVTYLSLDYHSMFFSCNYHCIEEACLDCRRTSCGRIPAKLVV